MLTRFWPLHTTKHKSSHKGSCIYLLFPRNYTNTPFSPELHAPQTIANLAALLTAPIHSYQSVLTLLALPRYVPLLSQQLFATRRAIAHAVVASVLKNETVIESPGDVDGVLDLCHVLVKDQGDAAAQNGPQVNMQEGRRMGPSFYLEQEGLAEEQGWIARMVHLFRADSLDVQYDVSGCTCCWLQNTDGTL
jgi:vacuolar protein sorting-associated protein 35